MKAKNSTKQRYSFTTGQEGKDHSYQVIGDKDGHTGQPK